MKIFSFLSLPLASLCLGLLFLLGTSERAEAKPAKTKIEIPLASGQTKNAICRLQNKRWRLRKTKSQTKKGGGKGFVKKAKRTCKSLVPPNKNAGSLDETPSLADIVNSVKKLKSLSHGFFPEAVSGTPPLTASLPQLDVTTLFWRDGVVSRIAEGNATPDDCNDFFGGNNDGDSGGLSGCFNVQSSAFSIQNLLSSGTSLCFMRNLPALGTGNGVTIVSGEESIPNGKLSKIFQSPKGNSTRTVEIQVFGLQDPEQEQSSEEQRILIDISNATERKNSNTIYGHTIHFCPQTGSTPEEIEHATIGKDGKLFLSSSGTRQGEVYKNVVTGYLTLEASDGGKKQLTFNPKLERTADVLFKNVAQDISEKASLTITPQNTIEGKIYSISSLYETRRAYSIVQFDSGDNVAELRILGGAYKDEKEDADGNINEGEGFQSGIEFRQDRYVAAPDSELVQQLAEVNLQSDSFYTKSDITFEPDDFDCTQAADVVIRMDFSQPAVQELQTICEGEILQDMQFCSDSSLVSQAEQNYGTSCQF